MKTAGGAVGARERGTLRDDKLARLARVAALAHALVVPKLVDTLATVLTRIRETLVGDALAEDAGVAVVAGACLVVGHTLTIVCARRCARRAVDQRVAYRRGVGRSKT